MIHIKPMTHYTRADLDMADRHIAEAERHIAGQEVLLVRLQMHDVPTDGAEKLLDLFNSTMVEHRAHRAAIAEALATSGR